MGETARHTRNKHESNSAHASPSTPKHHTGSVCLCVCVCVYVYVYVYVYVCVCGPRLEGTTYINVQIHGPEDAQDALIGDDPLPSHGPHRDVVDGRTHRQLHQLHTQNPAKEHRHKVRIGKRHAYSHWEESRQRAEGSGHTPSSTLDSDPEKTPPPSAATKTTSNHEQHNASYMSGDTCRPPQAESCRGTGYRVQVPTGLSRHSSMARRIRPTPSPSRITPALSASANMLDRKLADTSCT